MRINEKNLEGIKPLRSKRFILSFLGTEINVLMV